MVVIYNRQEYQGGSKGPGMSYYCVTAVVLVHDLLLYHLICNLRPYHSTAVVVKGYAVIITAVAGTTEYKLVPFQCLMYTRKASSPGSFPAFNFFMFHVLLFSMRHGKLGMGLSGMRLRINVCILLCTLTASLV